MKTLPAASTTWLPALSSSSNLTRPKRGEVAGGSQGACRRRLRRLRRRNGETGRNSLQQQRWTDAENGCEGPHAPQRYQPDAWTTFNTQSMLGARSGQKKYTEAEPLLLVGYDGMKKREATIGAEGKARLTDTLERLVQLYEATGKNDEAAKCARNSKTRRRAVPIRRNSRDRRNFVGCRYAPMGSCARPCADGALEVGTNPQFHGRISPELRPIFCEALEMASEEERRAYLTGRARATRPPGSHRCPLLAHHDLGEFLRAGSTPSVTLDAPGSLEAPGTIIGPYKLMEQIGEGLGLVFVAEQQQPVRRKVALKVIKPGMDSRQVIARLRPSGRHWTDGHPVLRECSMRELPVGPALLRHGAGARIPITDYCNRNQLTPRSGWGYLRCLPHNPACPSERHHSPRRQTLEYAGRLARRQAGGEGH